MALVHWNVYSHALEKDTGIYVVLPEYKNIKAGKRLRTLYLLHGLNDDYTKWVRRTPIERYAKENDWIIIMPDGEKGYYTNNVQGNRYWDYFGEELPDLMKTYLPFISAQRKDNYAAGLSMGGYGSMKLALNYPERFCAAASFSGALDLRKEFKDYPEYRDVYERAFGSVERMAGTENDLFAAAAKLKEDKKQIPGLYITCGLQDDIYPQSKEFSACLDSLDIPYTFEKWGGGHDWVFWDESIKRALTWFLTYGQRKND